MLAQNLACWANLLWIVMNLGISVKSQSHLNGLMVSLHLGKGPVDLPSLVQHDTVRVWHFVKFADLLLLFSSLNCVASEHVSRPLCLSNVPFGHAFVEWCGGRDSWPAWVLQHFSTCIDWLEVSYSSCWRKRLLQLLSREHRQLLVLVYLVVTANDGMRNWSFHWVMKSTHSFSLKEVVFLYLTWSHSR